MKIVYKLLISIIAVILGFPNVFAQATLTIGTINGNAGNNLSIPVTATNISDMQGFQFTIDYDETKLAYESCSNWGGGTNASGVQITQLDGKITFVYNDALVNITEGKFFDLNFTIKNDVSGEALIVWSDSPTARELSNSIPEEINCTYTDGKIVISEVAGATLSITSVDGDSGSSVSVPVIATNISDMQGFQFTIDFDETKLTYESCSNWGGGANASGVQITQLDGKITFVYNDALVNITEGKFFDLNFTIKNDVSGEALIIWSDSPTARELSNSIPEEISCIYTDGMVTIISMPELTIEPSNRDVESSAGSAAFEIVSNINWTVSDDSEWLILSPESGSNNGTLTATYEENTTTSLRIGTITISGAGVTTQTVTVTQAAADKILSVTPNNRDVESSAGSATFEIVSNINWTVSDDSEWLTLSPESGSNNGTLTATYEENTTTSTRIGSIKISGTGVSEKIATITQAGNLSELVNVALSSNGGVATASSSGSYAGYSATPEKAIDGDNTTPWYGTSVPDWIIVEFDNIYTIEVVGLYISYHTQTINVELSVDGVNWQTVVSPFTSKDDFPSGQDDSEYRTFDITAQNAKYIRANFTFTDAPNSHIYQCGLNEIQAYGANSIEGDWVEDFESYNPGDFPNLWKDDANATNHSQNYIDDAISSQGSKSLKLYGSIGGCWGALAYRALNIQDSVIHVELDVRNGSEALSGCHPYGASIALRKGDSWANPARALIDFRDGYIYGSNDIDLGTYQKNIWYRVKIKYEMLSLDEIGLSFWVDGDFKASTIVKKIPEESLLNNLQLAVQEGSAWFDNLKVYGLVDNIHDGLVVNNIINIYPNPTSGNLTLEFESFKAREIKISDLMGRIMIIKPIFNKNEAIDLSAFEKGIYLISIQEDDKTFTTRIVKQ